MQFQKPILAISDLTENSDAAIHFAGRLARALGSELHVLHALSMRYRALRGVVPALNNINSVLGSVEATMRAQVARVAPEQDATMLVDLDDAARALRRHANDVSPMMLVVPGLWDWTSTGRNHGTTLQSLFGAVETPVVVVREARAMCNRVVVVSSSDGFNSETVEAAGRWRFWLDHVYESAGATGGPDFDVIQLDNHAPVAAVAARIADPRTDLIVLDNALLDNAEMAEPLATLMPIVLRQTTAPIVLLRPMEAARLEPTTLSGREMCTR